MAFSAASSPAASSLQSSLSSEHSRALQQFLGNQLPLTKATLLYRASHDGFAAADYCRHCANHAHTLTLVHVKRRGFLCGAYAAFAWPSDAGMKSGYVADPSGTSFLF